MSGSTRDGASGCEPDGADGLGSGQSSLALQAALDRQQKLIDELNDEIRRLRAELAEADFVARVGMGVIVGVQLDQLTHGQQQAD